MDSLSNNRRRTWRRMVGVLLALSLAAACGNDTDEGASNNGSTPISSTTLASDVEDVTPGGTLVVGLEAETNTFLPSAGTFNNPGVVIARAIFDPIAARGADGEIYPYLAESIEPNEDLSEWTITLPEGIKFHDGTPLDAETIKANFDEYLSAEGARSASSAAEVTELRVDGPLQYTYILEAGNAAFPDLLTGVLGWPFSIEACRAAGEACGDQPVGTGPFVFESWTRDFELRATKNPDYWRTDAQGNQLPYLDEVVFRPIPDEDSRFQSVRSGDVQVGQTLRQSIVRQAMSAADAGEMQNLMTLGNNGGGSIFNVLVPPVDDVRVRTGLAHAIDQSALVKILGGEGISPNQTQFFSQDSPWFSQAVEDAYPSYDPERAQELLDEYINDPERSDGKAAGAPIQVDFNFPPDPTLSDVAQAYQAFWNAVGVEATLHQVDQSIHITRGIGSADTDPPFKGDYMINIWRMGDQNDPYTTLQGQFGDPNTEPSNVTNYTSDNVLAQIEKLRTSNDFAERYEAVESIMMEFTEQVPLVWTGSTAAALYANNAVRNLGGWTIPGGIQGAGTISATTFLTETWIE